MADEKNRDLLLSPDTYVYMQNEGKNGMISVWIGPGVVNQTGQDKPVVYDQKTRTYRPSSLDAAVQQYPRAEEGDYVILENPSINNDFPANPQQQAAPLNKGRKIVLPGPWSQALFPGQSAKVVNGHRLRSNQYLLVTIYNEDEARANWNKAIVKSASANEGDAKLTAAVDFTVGERIIIKGTEVSFYIPPTGVEVVPDEKGEYVREAVTLEQLEYSILTDEGGTKRFPRGPLVVFPEPTERFQSDANGNRKFKALELNDIQGIHIKVIQTYEEGGKEFKEGEELFLTGKDQQIYFPREEHYVIQYGRGNLKHYSTAVPLGEGRYVMNRKTGEITTEVGPKMLLPDPRSQVIVRRILTDKQCNLWYPGNSDALQYNRDLRQLSAGQPSARSGFVSEGDYKKGSGKSALFESLDEGLASAEGVGASHLVQKLMRETQYTQPRHVVLDTKFDGVPTIGVYTGYAVLVISKSGDRRVVVGPKIVLLNYDESLEELTLSTGKPKNADNLLPTCYLRVINNKISDIVEVETSDHVKATVKLSLCVNFEGDPNNWFNVENYVKYLTDHVRSILKGTVKKVSCRDFYQNYLPIIRDAILGPKTANETRKGLAFTENGMRVTEVEVLDMGLNDPQIATILDSYQKDVVKQDIKLDQARKTLDVTKEEQRISVQTADALHQTSVHTLDLAIEKLTKEIELEVSKIEGEITKIKQNQAQQVEHESLLLLSFNGKMDRNKLESEQKLEIARQDQTIRLADLNAQTEAAVKRLTATKENFAEALVALSREETMVKVAQATSIETFMSGDGMESSLTRLMASFPMLQHTWDKVKNAPQNGNRLNQAVPSKS